MEVVFKKYFWFLNGLLLVLLGFLVARFLASYASFLLQGDVAGGRTASSVNISESASGFRANNAGDRIDGLRRKELIKSSIPEPAPRDEPPPPPPPPKEDYPEEPEEPLGDLDFQYQGAIVSSNPLNSLAFVKVESEDSRWVSVGESLKGEIRVAQITRQFVRATDGTTRYLWQAKEDPKTRPPPSPRRPVPPPPPSPVASADTDSDSDPGSAMEGITKVGPWEYHIERALIDEQLQDLTKLGRQARVIPNYDRDSGGYKGFKLIGVRPNSLYRGIGIRSGDVILQVNGEELNSPSKALELFTKLQTSNQITLDLKRRGKNETLVYKIQ